MTDHDNFDRSLADWLHTDALSAAPTGGLGRAMDVTRRIRPRPGWLARAGSRWVGTPAAAGTSSGNRTKTHLGLRWSTAFILILVIAALVGGAILAGARLLQLPPVPADSLSHLAYGLDGSIYVADLDGRNPVRIAAGVLDPGGAGPAGCGSYWGEGPIWSPDGRHLAYRSAWDDASCHGTPGEGQVYIADPDGNSVTSFPGVGWLVSWSPDSTRVATSVDLGHTFGIYGLDGVRQALLTVPLGYQVQGDYSPVWSPDGMSLLMPIAPIAPHRPSEIWELPIDGGTPRRVPDADPRSHGGSAYSPDGSHVAYFVDSGHDEAGAEETLNVAAADGSQVRVLSSEPVGAILAGSAASLSDPVWSPTGNQIIFSWTTDAFRVVDVASGVAVPLALPSGPHDFSVIKFAPEGDRILLSGLDSNSDATSLWSMRADGSDLQLLVSGTDWGDWQPVPTAR